MPFIHLLEHPLQVACRQVAPASQLPVAKLECFSNMKNWLDEELLDFPPSHPLTSDFDLYFIFLLSIFEHTLWVIKLVPNKHVYLISIPHEAFLPLFLSSLEFIRNAPSIILEDLASSIWRDENWKKMKMNDKINISD